MSVARCKAEVSIVNLLILLNASRCFANALVAEVFNTELTKDCCLSNVFIAGVCVNFVSIQICYSAKMRGYIISV